MRLDEPSWWYPQTPRRIATFLQPLGALYGWAAEARYFRATPYRSRLPIICVGNFTAGGTGKTPLAIYLCERLKAAGHEPAALTRGYGGRLSGPYWVNGRSDVARDVGDEALLLAKAAPTLVARDRRIGARASVAPAGSTDWLKGARVVAWAGIGAPQRFFATLQALDADVVETIAFRDHQWLGEDDARRLLDLARRHSAALVTTEKDMARLAGAHGLCGELKGATRVVPVRLTLADPDAERLFSLIATALQTPRS